MIVRIERKELRKESNKRAIKSMFEEYQTINYLSIPPSTNPKPIQLGTQTHQQQLAPSPYSLFYFPIIIIVRILTDITRASHSYLHNLQLYKPFIDFGPNVPFNVLTFISR